MTPSGNKTPLLIFFALGFTAQLAQLVLIRELLATFQGNEVAFAIVFGAWLFWTAIGSLLARKEQLPPQSTAAAAEDADAFFSQRARSNFALAAVVLSLFLPLEVFGIRMLRPLCGVIAGQYVPLPQLVTGALFLFAPVGLCLGAQFVYAAQAIRSPTRVYCGEAAGSAVAGFVLSLFLVPVLNAFGMAYFAASVSLLMAAWFLRPEEEPVPRENHVWPHFQRRRKSIMHAGLFAPLLALAVLSAFCLAYSRVPDEYSRGQFWKAAAPAFKLVADAASPYGDFAVLSQDRQYHVYQNGRLVCALPDHGETAPLVHLFMTQHPKPERVLLIGGGLSGMLKAMLQHRVAQVDYMEPDPRLLLVAQPFASVEDCKTLGDPRVTFRSGECRSFLRHGQGCYSLVILNVGDPDTARINRFYTLEFFREVRARLAPGGVICLGPLAANPGQAPDPARERNATIYWTLRRVFDHVLATPGPALCLMASDAPNAPTLSMPTIQQRLEARGIANADDMTGFPDVAAAQQVNHELRTGQRANPDDPRHIAPNVILAPNTDERPAAYFLSMHMWAGIVGDRTMSWIMATFQGLRGLTLMLLIGAGLMTILVACGRWRTGAFTQPAIMYGIFAIGLSGMVASMMTMFAFQTVLGSIYRFVGLMLALFMTGIAIGAMLTRRLEERPAKKRTMTASKRLVMTLMLFSIFLAVLPTLLRLPAALVKPELQQLVFGLANLLAGLCVGAAYPLGIAAIATQRGSTGSDDAALYAVDLIGGCLGALVVSVFILPLFGFDFACYGCAVLLTSAAFLMSLAARRA